MSRRIGWWRNPHRLLASGDRNIPHLLNPRSNVADPVPARRRPPQGRGTPGCCTTEPGPLSVALEGLGTVGGGGGWWR